MTSWTLFVGILVVIAIIIMAIDTYVLNQLYLCGTMTCSGSNTNCCVTNGTVSTTSCSCITSGNGSNINPINMVWATGIFLGLIALIVIVYLIYYFLFVPVVPATPERVINIPPPPYPYTAYATPPQQVLPAGMVPVTTVPTAVPTAVRPAVPVSI